MRQFFCRLFSLRTKVQVARDRLALQQQNKPKLPNKRTDKRTWYNVIPETLTAFKPTTPVSTQTGDTLLSLGLREYMREMGFERMTPVQRLLFDRIHHGKSVFGGAETGSGKTLAYLFPLIQRLKQSATNDSLLLVCVPTRELVTQVLGVAKGLAHHCKFRPRTFQHEDWQHADLLIGLPREFTSSRVLTELERKSVAAVVIDEADTLLLDSGFSEDVRFLLDATPDSQRVVVSATMPPPLLKKLKTWVSGVEAVATTGFLKPVKTLTQLFMDVKVPQAQKPQRCRQLLQTDEYLRTQRNVIFCNSIASAQHLYHTLLPYPEIQATVLHGKISPHQRLNLLRAFEDSGGGVRNVIATDLLARGVDLRVDNVVLYDFPHTLAEYLHRVGRTARAGRSGRVFALVSSRDRPFFHKLKSILSSNNSCKSK